VFESRLQTAQAWLLVGLILAMIGSVILWLGPAAVGVFCLVLQSAAAAAGCYLYADVKGYPGLIGIPIGVGLGVMGALVIRILPDQTDANQRERQDRLAREGFKASRRRKDPGYEVLDKDPSPYD
jgi:hypothetical protein